MWTPSLYGQQSPSSEPSLTAHEWGTFTSVAGADGRAVDWLPISASSELPDFVQYHRGVNFKAGLRGTVRMETPVIYFYTPRETTVSVHVSFSNGLITEWYPDATNFSPRDALSGVALYNPHADGSLTWNHITLTPNKAPAFPQSRVASHYYAARETSSVPVSVKMPSGEEHEKFLFYRGVSTVSLPVSAAVIADGRVQVENRSRTPIPTLILFERHGNKLGYTVLTSLQNRTVLKTPSLTSNVESHRKDFENILIAQGLYPDEAQAMLETWRDSWFEEGSRLFYIVPRSLVDSVLPLSINPTPAQLTRVFVGRLELLSPRTQSSIETALASHDSQTLQKYGRFLEPFLKLILSKQSAPGHVAQLRQDLAAFYNSRLPQAQ